MWYIMETVQRSYEMSERLIRAISNWNLVDQPFDDDIEELINNGADVNQPHGSLLPLHCTCMVSDAECLQLLLQNGARVNDLDGYLRTALHYAAEKDEQCILILLQHGANINARDGSGNTPLHWASYKNKIECVQVLLQQGADPDVRNDNSDTPLSWAALKGNLKIIQLLLEYNADLCNRNTRGYTPLMQAAYVQSRGLNCLDNTSLELLIKASGPSGMHSKCVDLISELCQDNKVKKLLLSLCRNPCALQNLCCLVIRKALGYCYLPEVIPKLPLPTQLQKLLMLQT
ncbi:repeat and SOCS box 8-like [Octopus vulgaris]|uniref:Repeat and SOCS box 8-like n=2 Tax=Octopus TaxID=6643 RepID=A0AA36BQ39_OCTVU|nr:ankyrin repeat and SOCS box protein 8 [Octopus sinensis]XP_029649212.1 ankyrin repeat and SOCS box protein 8 [Octopus sinensis]CAI9738498.1 repeat and SOCS box 8-like [Octopus vulgaris]